MCDCCKSARDNLYSFKLKAATLSKGVVVPIKPLVTSRTLFSSNSKNIQAVKKSVSNSNFNYQSMMKFF